MQSATKGGRWGGVPSLCQALCFLLAIIGSITFVTALSTVIVVVLVSIVMVTTHALSGIDIPHYSRQLKRLCGSISLRVAFKPHLQAGAIL